MTQERSPLSLPILALPNEDACSRGRPVRSGWAPDTLAARLVSAFTTLPITQLPSTTSLTLFSSEENKLKGIGHADFQQQAKSAVTNADRCVVRSEQTLESSGQEKGVTTANPAERHSGLSRDRVGQGHGALTLIHLTSQASMKESLRRS